MTITAEAHADRGPPAPRKVSKPGWFERLLAAGVVWLAAGLLAATAASGGTLRPFTYRSPALGQDQTAQVYVPTGTPPVGGWPVLYLLHGLNGTTIDWQSMGNIASTLDTLVTTGAIRPFVVVMPPGGNSWYVDSAVVNGPGDYATAIARDLPDAIEAAFPVGRDKNHRAIAGLSMGGFGALRLGLSWPERFGAIAALSPAIWQNIPDAVIARPKELDRMRGAYFHAADPDDVTVGLALPPEGSHFGSAFGTPFDPRRFNAANVFTALEQAFETHKPLPRIFLTIGDDDSHLLWRGAFAFFETMQANGRSLEFRVTDGDHNWTCWKKALTEALVFTDRSFGRTALEKDAAIH